MNATSYRHTNGVAGPVKTKGAVTVEEEKKPPMIDAGLRNADHYKRALPKWRYDLRELALNLIRWETPYLAWLQGALRSPALDSYFAITANLGTHTFFMIGLPILFWCGNGSFGKGIVHILASGVFFTGFVKDFFSLPRPLSPPLHRITMSGSAALEYGFPSTHSANAVSVAVYAILCLHSQNNNLTNENYSSQQLNDDPSGSHTIPTHLALEALAYFYAISIVFGRLYCGMHGFVDVIVGSAMGALISLVEFYYGPSLDTYLQTGGWTSLCTFLLIIIILVRVHPEPADDCPCFDDSVAFAGVMIGLEIGTWRFSRSTFADIPFDLEALGWGAVATRILFGVLVIFAWREIAKPSLLRGLPHLFRLIENQGLSLPRRFFMPASEYKNIPLRLRVDNVMPNVSDLPNLITAVRHPGRGRSVSVGPQSAADAYETLAYRERRRRESVDVGNGSPGGAASTGAGGLRNRASVQDIGRSQQQQLNDDGRTAQSSAVSGNGSGSNSAVPRLTTSDYEKLMGEGTVVVSPVETNPASPGGAGEEEEPDVYVGQQDELGESEVFSRLIKPRVRYDVEVVTKLVVYCGIGWLAVEIIPVLYEFIPGLGAGHLRVS